MKFIFSVEIEVIGEISRQKFAVEFEKAIISVMQTLCSDQKIKINMKDTKLT